MTKATNWEEFVKNHPDTKSLELIMAEMKNLLNPNQAEENFKILESSPSTILVSYDNIQHSIVPSFFHQSIGNGLLHRKVDHVGLTGLSDTASPIILNEAIFSSFKSDKVSIPSWNDLLNEKEEAVGDKPTRTEFRRFAIVPPPLIDAICGLDLSPEAVLDRAVSILAQDQDKIQAVLINIIKLELMKDNDGQPASTEEIEKATSDENLLAMMEDCFFDFLF